MRKIICAVGAVLLAASLAACSVTIPLGPNVPPLKLTGNIGDDWPGIEATAAAIKARLQVNAAKVKAAFDKLCPHVQEAQAAIGSPTAQTAAASLTGSPDNGAKWINNIQQGIALGGLICAGVEAPSDQKLVTVVDAVKGAKNLIETGSVSP